MGLPVRPNSADRMLKKTQKPKNPILWHENMQKQLCNQGPRDHFKKQCANYKNNVSFIK